METMSNFFEAINRFLGVSTPGELVFHPVFMGVCIVIFLYTLFTGMKYFAVGLAAIMGGAAIIHYFYPENSSNLSELIKFVGIMGAFALVLIYFGFVRD
ncbi:hypothetical protein [Desulfomonile tiedjei]|uniref:Uncharacterized protein n=1 Tax=Desulfomonile tiedjei (strain ATCC 49306 / DSM 6799 / DCB-1) TaxID=706587 RepID=I4C359_DESTA|nr:hypothetical protein [Desulfomonile tiedjei]AFM24000.1 hypothetical protein Desti_1287 [Desulfomonile tiedjei DSM 6799]